jgi:hypothetical protein
MNTQGKYYIQFRGGKPIGVKVSPLNWNELVSTIQENGLLRVKEIFHYGLNKSGKMGAKCQIERWLLLELWKAVYLAERQQDRERNKQAPTSC